MTKHQSSIKPLLLLLLMAGVVRLYRINFPLLDWHSFRQTDTASVTREYVKHGIDILHPRYQDLGNTQSGEHNPQGWRMVEFPWLNAITAALLMAVPNLPEIPTGRFISILFSLGTIASLFYLVKMYASEKIAWFTAAFYAFLPYSVYYSRTILPEVPLVTLTTFSLLAFAKWGREKSMSWYIVSWLSLTLALLTKPSALFLMPVFLMVGWVEQKHKFLFSWQTYFMGTTLLPMLGWRQWISQYPAGIPAFDWLLNGNKIRFRPAWFRWLGYERLGKMITGLTSWIFLPISLIKMPSPSNLVFLSWWLSIFIYFAVIATGNIQHDYYQSLTIPIVAWTMAAGSYYLWQVLRKFSNPTATVVTVALVITGWWISWENVRGFFNVNHWEYVQAGKKVDEITPADALVIAPADTDTMFLFQTNRKGWAIGGDIEDKIGRGADYYVSTNLNDETNRLKSTYQTAFQNEKFIIINLNQKIEQQNQQVLEAK